MLHSIEIVNLQSEGENTWDQPKHCPYYMVKVCPYDLFYNTRLHLGECPKDHNDEMKKLFDDEKIKLRRKCHYMETFLELCSNIIDKVERNIGRTKRKILLNGPSVDVTLTAYESQNVEQEISFLFKKIENLQFICFLAQNSGDYKMAQVCMESCLNLQVENNNLAKILEHSKMSDTVRQTDVRLCNLCGTTVTAKDYQEHLTKKIHVGFVYLKTASEEVKKVKDELQKEWDEQRDLQLEDELENFDLPNINEVVSNCNCENRISNLMRRTDENERLLHDLMAYVLNIDGLERNKDFQSQLSVEQPSPVIHHSDRGTVDLSTIRIPCIDIDHEKTGGYFIDHDQELEMSRSQDFDLHVNEKDKMDRRQDEVDNIGVYLPMRPKANYLCLKLLPLD